MFQLDQIRHFYGQQGALDLLHFAGRQGEHHFILGLSGGGKTTLLHLMASLLLGHSATYPGPGRVDTEGAIDENQRPDGGPGRKMIDCSGAWRWRHLGAAAGHPSLLNQHRQGAGGRVDIATQTPQIHGVKHPKTRARYVRLCRSAAGHHAGSCSARALLATVRKGRRAGGDDATLHAAAGAIDSARTLTSQRQSHSGLFLLPAGGSQSLIEVNSSKGRHVQLQNHRMRGTLKLFKEAQDRFFYRMTDAAPCSRVRGEAENNPRLFGKTDS